jgi:drug/metabolite transporter (DMT)-like permease
MTTTKAILLLLIYLIIVPGIAALIAYIFSKYLSPKIDNIFKPTLKYGVLGSFIGFIIFFILWYFHNAQTGSWSQAGWLATIPFYTMLAGTYIGFVIALRKHKKTKI